MQLVRTPAVDFSPHSLRETLPRGERRGRARWPGDRWSAQQAAPAPPFGLATPTLQTQAQRHACTLGANHLCWGSASIPCYPAITAPALCPPPSAAVRALEDARASGAKVYVHCTAGLGRSPAVAIASLYWFTSMQARQPGWLFWDREEQHAAGDRRSTALGMGCLGVLRTAAGNPPERAHQGMPAPFLPPAAARGVCLFDRHPAVRAQQGGELLMACLGSCRWQRSSRPRAALGLLAPHGT